MWQPITVLSLNVGRFLQDRTNLALWDAVCVHKPDVICLQDTPRKFGHDLLMSGYDYSTFATMTIHCINGVQQNGETDVGIGIYSKYPLNEVVSHVTWGNGEAKYLQGVENNQRHLGVESDRLVEVSEDRFVIFATIVKENQWFNLATTHGAWVRGGIANDYQRRSTRSLIHALYIEKAWRGGVCLIGDMNINRGGEIYQALQSAGFTDRIPAEIDSTLDPDHPYSKKGGRVVTDYVFTGGRADEFGVDVKLLSGISDHCALLVKVCDQQAL